MRSHRLLSNGKTTSDACVRNSMEAAKILQTYCSRCHGGDTAGARQGQPPFDYVMNLTKLEAAVSSSVIDPVTKAPMRFLVPGQPERSRIYVRAAKGEMPPRDGVQPAAVGGSDAGADAGAADGSDL